MLICRASVALRRSFLVHWQPYMDECLEILENSPDALPSDKMLIHLVKLTHLSEEIGVQFSTEDTDSGVSFSDPKVQYTLKAFEKQLFQWRKDVSPENYSRKYNADYLDKADRSAILRQSEHIVNLYMHEAAMHIDTNVAQATPDDNGPGPAHINALTSCLTSVHEALDAICSVDIKAVMCLPTILLARTSYAIIALIKLYALASAPESKIGQVIDPASLQVEYHLDRVLNHYKAAGEQEGARTPFKFSIVLSLLRDWFVKRKDQGPALGEVFGGFCKPVTLGDEVYSGNEERSQVCHYPYPRIMTDREENDYALATTERSRNGGSEQGTSEPILVSRVPIRYTLDYSPEHESKHRLGNMDAAISLSPGIIHSAIPTPIPTILPRVPVPRHASAGTRRKLPRSNSGSRWDSPPKHKRSLRSWARIRP